MTAIQKILSILITVSVLGVAPHASAQIINIQLNGGSTTNPYTGTGADPNLSSSSTSTWNLFVGSQSDAAVGFDSSGNALTANGTTIAGPVTFSVAASGGYNLSGPNSNDLLNTWVDYIPRANGFGTTAPFELTGFAPDTNFTLYLYGGIRGGGGSGYSTGFSLSAANGSNSGSAVSISALTGFGSAPTPNSNSSSPYVILTGQTDSLGDINGTYNYINNGEADFNGLQVDFTAVPEPSSYVLMLVGLGALALLARMRRV